jgi:branched-chain amino acid aminotransferase
LDFSAGSFQSTDAIYIKPDSTGANRGYGAFDFFGVINGIAFYLDRHLDRFFNTMNILRLSIALTKNEVKAIIEEVIQRNQHKDFHIKLFAYPTDNYLQKTIPADLFVIPLIVPVDPAFKYAEGVKLIMKEYQRFLPEAKSTNYLPLVYWQNGINDSGAVDVLYYSDGFIRESSRGNVFVVKANQVFTPGEQMLKGITRSVVMDILWDNSIAVKEKNISMEELFEADEVFLSSTTKKILPITKIDTQIIGNGKVGPNSKSVYDLFNQLQLNWGK